MSKLSLPPMYFRVRDALKRRGRSTHDAEDIVQEAWMKYMSYERERAVEKPEALLMHIAMNLAVDGHRARAREGSQLLLEDVVVADESPSVEAVVLGRERVARLTQCLGRLSPKNREILLAYRLDGLTYREIAEHHGLSTSTVEKHIAKATLQLLIWMEDW